MKTFEVNGIEIGGARTYVVAEMAWSHDGEKELALEIVRGAAKAGADCISVHITNVPAYMVPHYGSGAGRVSAGKDDTKIFQYLCKANIEDTCWPEIVAAARENGLAVAIMPNDFPSLELARSMKPDLYVIHAACFTEEDMVRAVAKEGKSMLLRVGGATLGEIERVLDMLAGEGVADLVLLFGQQNYPTKIEDTELRKLTSLRTAFGHPVGLADHIDAEDPAGQQIPLLALPLGACVIEKHVTHDRAKRGEDHESALNPDELASLVTLLRKAERSLGTPYFRGLGESQRKYRLVSRKRIVAARPIAAGKVIEKQDVTCKRSDSGRFPEDMHLVIGRMAAREIGENEGIEWDTLC